MIIVLKQDAPDAQVREFCHELQDMGLQINDSKGSDTHILGLIGDTKAIAESWVLANPVVETCRRVSEPYKKANRKFHPDDSVIDVNGVKIGGGNFAVIAGPCSIESEEQITYCAQRVKNAGASLLRGGAFKPRTSPYSFQGLRAEGLELLKEARALEPQLQQWRRTLHRHPALRLRLLFSDQLTDVFKDPVDVAFRYGNNDDASFISLPVAPENRRVLVASPEWIARHGEPQTLEELSQHNALIYILRGRPFDRWSLSLDGVVQQQKVSGTVMSDDAEVIRRLAIAGEGIAYKSMLDVSDDLRAGRLRRLLPRYQGDVVPLNLICPHRKQLSAAVRLLYEEVKSHCEGLNA